MEIRQCIRFCMYLLVWRSVIWLPGSCVLGDSLSTSSQVADFPNSNSNSGSDKTFSPTKKFLMQSYYDIYTNLLDSDFGSFLSQEVTSGSCEWLPDNNKFVLRLSVIKRDLIGEGSHRRVSTLIKFQTQHSKSLSELLSFSCEFIIIERLPSGVFADPFELQRLVQRGVFNDIAVFGDTNLELPSFMSNRSAVEIHLDVDQNILLQPTDINIDLPLHARYQPLNESGYSTVEFGAPDILMRCSTKEKRETHNCFFKLTNDDANLYDASIVWRIPSGRMEHAYLVSSFTFIAALLSTLVADFPNSNSNSGSDKTFSPTKKFLMQSYYDIYTNLLDSDFGSFLSREVTFGSCEWLPDNHKFVLRLSVLKRDLIGEGSHRHVFTLIRFQTQQSKSLSELLSSSCEFIIIERLPSGVFADPFELQRLVQRGVFNDIAVFGDTNLELPSFMSNRSAVEIHLDVDQNILLQPTDINIDLPLHARYQPLNESGYSTVEFGAPDILMRCSTKGKRETHNCFFKLTNDDANLYDASIVWRIPSGRMEHAYLVSTFTFIAALLSTLVIVFTSLYYSNIRVGKDLKLS